MNPTPVVQPGGVLHGQAFVFTVSLFFFLFVLELVRRKKVNERFSLLWIVIATVLGLASSFGFPFLFRLAPLLGIVYPATALFLMAFIGLTLLILYLTVVISRLSMQSRTLAQRVALLEARQTEEKVLLDRLSP